MNSGPSPEQSSVWYLAYTRPRQEFVAHLNLEQQGFEAYLPLYKQLKRGEAGGVLEPMFPRYLIFRPRHPEQSIGVVRSTRGVMTLVRFGYEPATLGDAAVANIRAFEEARKSTSVADITRFKAGQAVRVMDGALEGLEGLVHEVSSKRVVVLLHLLGRVTPVRMAHHEVSAV